MLWRVNDTIGCLGITVYWSGTIFIISLKENNVCVKLFETFFDSDILASFVIPLVVISMILTITLYLYLFLCNHTAYIQVPRKF